MTNEQARLQFIERMGQQAANDGLTRSAGQIWAALLLSDEMMSSAELAELLQITKGSISTNVRTLETLHIVERRFKPGDRQDYYAIQENPYTALVEGQIRRFDNANKIVAEALDGVRGGSAQVKLTELARFYQLYQQSAVGLLAAMKADPEPGSS